jgi:hypothetical protein
MGRLLPLVVAGGLVFATPAAATTTVEWYFGWSAGSDTLYLIDRDGEANSLDVSNLDRATVSERGRAGLRAGHDCRQRSSRIVTCPSTQDVGIRLGPGDDSLHVSGWWASLYGSAGRGDDRIALTGGADAWDAHGGAGRDVLRGAGKSDTLHGGTGRDRLEGRSGRDVLSGGRDRDVLDGGPGLDVVAWDGPPVRVDLARRHAAGDRLRSIEGARGTRGRDRLLGTAGDNLLFGRRGPDLLVGGAGDDVIGAGRDGQSDGFRDRVRCGPGTDMVRYPGLDPLGRECERFELAYDFYLPVQPRPLGRRRVAVKTPCRHAPGRCVRRVTLTKRGRVIGRSQTRHTRGSGSYWMPVRLRRPLPSRGPVRISIRGFSGKYRFAIAWRIRR